MALRAITRCHLTHTRQAVGRLVSRSQTIKTLAKQGTRSVATHGNFPGGQTVPFVDDIRIHVPDMKERIPAYRVMEQDGSLRPGATVPELDEETLLRMYRVMVRLQSMDQVFYDAQRQGRISFYMTSFGEEATQIGSAAAIDTHDMIFAQYREPGILMWRGFTLDNFADQCFATKDDYGKGRQMPVHYGTKALNYQTISSPLATQIPHAAGAAYAIKRSPQKGKIISVCYFGEGAASEGDFHAAMNIAATTESPVLFFCRNNGYAISTSVEDQFVGDGIAIRGASYGMASLRVDGNDLFAVYNATTAARQYILETGKPILLESMTYRQGHHSTSDDSTRYREVAEIKFWKEEHDPVVRFRNYLNKAGLWNDAQEQNLREGERQHVLDAMNKAENKDKPSLDTLFHDVYHDVPQHLKEQEQKMLEHIAKYPDQYHIGGH